MQKSRISRLMIMLLFFAGTLLYAQNVERWLHAPPGHESQFMKSPIGAQKPIGVIVPIKFEGWARDVTRFCRSLAQDMTPDSGYHQESIGPTLSEIKELEDRLLTAAIQASDTPIAGAPSTGSARLLSGSDLARDSTPDPYDMEIEKPAPRRAPGWEDRPTADPYR